MRITVEYVIAAQKKLIELTGGTPGIRDLGLIESAVNGIYQTFDFVELYPTIEDKAARLCFSLIENHGFVDGNKRIGVSILQTFLILNNYHLDITDKELYELGKGIAESKYDLKSIKDWIQIHKSQ